MGYPAPGATPASPASAPVTWPVRSGAVPPLAEKFCTRPESAPSLADALRRSPAVTLTSSQQSGFEPPDLVNACGKTQLAAFYAESQWQARAIALLVWIDASSRASILCGYAEAAAATGAGSILTGAETVAAGFLEWLARSERKWLVVLDDLADAHDIEGLWPHGPAGQVVLTTRGSASPGDHSLRLEVGSYSPRDAMSYLVARLTSDPGQRRGAIELIEDLGLQPLALAQASSVIRNSWLTCSDYRGHLAACRDQVGAVTGVRPPGAAVAWMLAADQADVLAQEGVAHACLAFAAVLDGHGIPADLFASLAARDYMAGPRAGRGRPAEPALNALQALERVGLVIVDRVGHPATVQMNPAVQAAVRAAIPVSLLNRAASAASSALLECWPDGDQLSRHAQLARSCALSLLRAAPELVWADGCPPVLIRAGESFDRACLTRPAVDYWNTLTTATARHLGPGHPDSMVLVEKLARAYGAAGQVGEATAWLKRLSATWSATLGPDDTSALRARVNLGHVLVLVGLADDAVGVLASAAEDCERMLGPEHPESQGARGELATALRAVGQVEEAIRLYQRVLADQESRAGPRDPAAIATRQKLAAAYLEAGRTKECIAQYKRALTDSERSLGAEHPATLRVRGALGVAYHRLGRMALSIQMNEQVHAASVRTLGADHEDTLAAATSLAGCYYSVGRLTDAARLYGEVLARADVILGQAHPLSQSARDGLAAIRGQSPS